MRALRIDARAAAPALAEVAPPAQGPGRALVRMRAVALNPVDLAIAAGRFYLPVPDPPYVPGAEGVGEVVASALHPPGTRVWCLARTGCLAELASVPEGALVPVPEGIDDRRAAAAGIAGLAGWMALRERGGLVPGETVVVLGAGGVVGRTAIQAARAGGAGRVVAVNRGADGRSRALALGADIAAPTGTELAGALAAACPEGADLVLDCLWGASAAAALGRLRPGGRLVQVGNAEAPAAELPAGPMRGGRLDIRGFSVFSEDPGDLARAYGELTAAIAGGVVALDPETVPLEKAPAAWARLAAGAGGAKLVVGIA